MKTLVQLFTVLTLVVFTTVLHGQSYTVIGGGYAEYESDGYPIDVYLLDDEVSSALPIGFDFEFFGITYTEFYMSSNGFITFDSDSDDGCCVDRYIPNSYDPNNIIALAWDDLNYFEDGYYSYETVGIPGSRKLLVSFYTDNCEMTLDGQIKLYEGSNKIELHVFDYYNYYCYEGSTQGIENAAGTEAFVYDYRNSDVWDAYFDMVEFIPTGLGANEDDAGILGNVARYCEGSQSIVTIVRNYGTNPIDSVTVNWEWDGVPQTPIYWDAFPISPGSNIGVTLGTKTLTFGTSYTLKAWTSDPNGVTDPAPSNDTVSTPVAVGMNGTYTIGGTAPDYPDFASALADLVSYGICDTTIFDIRDGTYTEQIEIPYINGSYGDSRVIFQSESRDSSAVTLQYAPGSGNNFVTSLSGANMVTFRDITFKALPSTHGRVVSITADCEDIEFMNCAFVGTGSSISTDFVNIFGYGLNHDILIQDSRIVGGSYGLYCSVVSGIGYPSNWKVIGNTVDSAYHRGLYFQRVNAPVVEMNTIRGSASTLIGIDLVDVDSNFSVAYNDVSMFQGEYGIQIYNSESFIGHEGTVHSNFVSTGALTEGGLYAWSCDLLNIYYNSLSHRGNGGTDAALEIVGGSDVVVQNNIAANLGGGYAYQTNSLIAVSSDRNNFYRPTPGTVVRYYNDSFPSLTEWREYSGFDLTSLSLPPLFNDTTDLHTTQSLFNRVAIPIAGITLDYDKDARDVSYPDIGADEFVPLPNDIQVYSLVSPNINCDASQDVVVAVRNLGANSVTSFDVSWTLNGVVQSTVPVSTSVGPAGSGDTVHVSLGSVPLLSDSNYTFKLWTEAPNGVGDTLPANDTLEVSYKLPLSGVVTVGGSIPDFNTIADVIDAMSAQGICDTVVVSIRDGIYDDIQITVPQFSGTSDSSGVIFTSEAGDASAVTIQNGTGEFVFRLEDARNIQFKDLTVRATKTYNMHVFELLGKCENISFLDNVISGTKYDNQDAELIRTLDGAPDSNLVVMGNTLIGGSEAIRAQGVDTNARVHQLVVSFNELSDQVSEGLEVVYASDVEINNNTIARDTLETTYYAMRFRYVDHGIDVYSNKVALQTTGVGLSFYLVNNQTDPVNGRIYNNFIATTMNDGVRIEDSRNLLFNYNNVKVTSPWISVNGLELAYSDSVEVVNNSIQANGGYAFSLYDQNDNSSDYNNLYSNNNTGYFSGAHSTLGDWQTATGWDANSISTDPLYTTAFDLHVFNGLLNAAGTPIPGIATDIDDEARNGTTPDIGADEIGTVANNISAHAIFPSQPFARGNLDVELVVRNLGNNSVTSFNVDWTFNDTVQTQFVYSGDLQPFMADTILLGTKYFEFNINNRIEAVTSLPNGVADIQPINDTISATGLYPGVSGILTIGGLSPDFDSLTNAVSAMATGGVLDSTTFRLRDGTYTESVVMNSYDGMSCDMPVIFESESQARENVILDDNGLTGPPLWLSGAKGLLFRDLTIQGYNSNAVVLSDSSHCNTFDNVHFIGLSTTSTSNGLATVYKLSKLDTANVFMNSLFENGSYGLYYNAQSPNYDQGIRVENCVFSNQYHRGLYMSRLSGARVLGNEVENSATTSSGFIGIEVDFGKDSCAILGNHIKLAGKSGTGIYCYAGTGDASNRSLIANNFVTIGNATASAGITVYSSAYYDVMYNSVRILGSHAGSNCFGVYYCNSIRAKNNVFVCESGGSALRPLSPSYFESCDFNDLVSNGLIAKTNGTDYADLAAWQVTGLDANSISEDPQFIDDEDLHAQSAMIDGTADPVSAITTDIDGDIRDSVNPDMGADEFNLTADDVGLLAINYPVQPFPAGLNTIFIKFANNGSDTLVSMQVDWEVDGVGQPTYYWTGLLSSGGTYDSLDIGTYDFDPYQSYDIKVWVSEPNGMTDGVASNDTLVSTGLYPGLLGTYTIGGVDPDFETINDALVPLDSGGAAGPVVFNIRDGIYLESLVIEEYPGSSCNSNVVFQSESLDSSKVTITNLGIDAHTVTISGADGLTFRHLTIESVNPAYRRVIEYNGNADCNTFENNHLKGYEGTSGSAIYAVVYSNTSADYGNLFQNNLITHGSYSLYIVGGDQVLSGTIIRNNRLDNPYAKGVGAVNEDGIIVESNVILNELTSDFQGIYLQNCDSLIQIRRNRVSCEAGRFGLYLNGCRSDASNRSLIANNFAAVGGSGTCYAYYFNNVQYADFVFNSGHNYTTSTASTSNTVFGSNGLVDLHMYNNVLLNSSLNGPVVDINNSGLSESNNNCFHNNSASNYISANGVVASDLTAWQSGSGLDGSSVDSDPQFISDTDLHAMLVLLNGGAVPINGITTDIDGDVRDAITPDIGADEFLPAASDDAGVIMMIGPLAPFASGLQPVQVALKNYGGNTLTQATVRWLINGLEQTQYNWSGSLAPGACDTITLGDYNFQPVLSYDLLSWSEFPNSVPDSVHINDTLTVNDIYAALAGTYTVGGSLPDFNLISQLEAALLKGGTIDDVVFAFRDGTYDAQLSVEEFIRLDPTDSITFRSENNDPAGVVLTRTFASGSDHTVSLDGVSNIALRNLTIESPYGTGLTIEGGSRDIVVDSCVFKGKTGSSSASYACISSGSSVEENIHITNSTFIDGSNAIRLFGASGLREEGTEILGCTFISQRGYAIDVRYQRGIKINNNVIKDSLYLSGGMKLLWLDSAFSVLANDIRLYAGTAIYLDDCHAWPASRGLIANNFCEVSGGVAFKSWGIYGDDLSETDFNYNTCRIESSNYSSVPFEIRGSYLGNIDVRNCVFANFSGNYAARTGWQYYSTNCTMDYCDLYSIGTPLVHWFIDYTDLSVLQASTGDNLNSISVDPIFTEPSGYELVQNSLNEGGTVLPGITSDISGGLRDPVSPDIGAFEFVPLSDDLYTKSVMSPTTYCGLTSSEPITIKIQNRGGSVQNAYTVGYSFNGGPWISEAVSASVFPGQTYNHTMTTTVNASMIGAYTMDAFVSLPGDENPEGDTLFGVTFEHIPALVDTPSNLLPIDSATSLDKPVALSWAPTPNATKYDVYIWSDGDAKPGMPQVGDISQINTTYNSLDYGETYKWQVVAKNSCGQSVDSKIQLFTVRTLPDLVVDTVIAPTTAFSGQDIEIEWIVENIGTGSTQSTLWTDAVYLSTDATLNTSFDTYLGGIQNLTALEATEEYAHSLQATLPEDVVGNYYLIVNTDRYNSVIESNNSNNWERSQTTLAVTLTPPPDLIVSSVVAPTLAFSGESINVLYEIENQGTGSTGQTSWKERVILSSDPFNAVGQILSQETFTGELLPDSTYSRTISVTLPQGISGNRYVFIETDYQNTVFEFGAEENNTGGSDSIVVVLSPTADLVMDTIFIPDTIDADSRIDVTWQVINEGGGPTLANYWRDELYLSTAPVFNNNFNKRIIGAYQYAEVASLDTYQLSGLAVIPELEEGQYYLYGFVDKNDNEYEFDMEGNNIFQDARLIQVMNADLLPIDLVHPDTADADVMFSFSFKVVNIGNGGYSNKYLRNRLYASNDSVLNTGTAYLIGDVNENNHIFGAGDTLMKTVGIALPPSLTGDVYLHVVADYTDAVYEGPSDTNNIATIATPIYLIEGPIPDLETIDFTHPDSIIAGLPYEITFGTVNNGLGVAEAPWKDRLYISFDSVWNEENAVLLSTISQTVDLEIGDTLPVLRSITLDPDFVENKYYLYVLSDYYDNIYEGIGEGDNVFRSTEVCVFEPPVIDLALDTILFDTSALKSGQQRSVSWTTAVVNGQQSIIPEWGDVFYLSTDQVLDTSFDIRLDAFVTDGNAANFGPGNPVTSEGMLKFPNGLSGDFYLFALVDETLLHNDTARSNNSGMLRNDLGQPLLMTIELSRSPDLTVNSFIAPTEIIAGQPFEIELAVKNIGDGPAIGTWRDRIYLSTDEVINVGDLLLIDEQRVTLDSSEVRTDTFSVTIPVSYNGNYVLIAAVDQGKSIYEYNGENNNQALRSVVLTVPPPSDLQVTDVVVPLEGVAGDSALVSWTTENVGSYPASGSFREIVYLSLDTAWDVQDALFGIVDKIGYLPPSSSELTELKAPLTNVFSDEYYAVVRTDVLDNFQESNEDNNTTTSIDRIDIDIKRLYIDSLTADTLTDLQELYYRIEVTPDLEGETMIVSLDGDSLNGINELYASFGEIPSRAEFDFGYDRPFSGQQRVIIPSLEVGTYYILGYGSTTVGTFQQVDLLARIVPFEIESISPMVGVKDTRVTVEIKGIKLDNTEKFRLRQNNPWFELVADTVFVFSDNLVYATFDLTGVPVDTYSIDAIKVDSSLAMVTDGFRVIETGEADLQFTVNAPRAVPSRSIPIKIVVAFQNVGDVDIEDTQIRVEAPYGNIIAPTLEDLRAGGGEDFILISVREENGPPGILRPNGAGVIEVFAWSTPAPTFVAGIND